jgi:hypothetical protein
MKFPFSALVASALISLVAFAAPALARPEATDQDEAVTSPRGDADTELPTDGRPIVATIVAIDEGAQRVMLSTPHGPVALLVSQDVVRRLHVGDVVVVHFTADDDYPAASPPIEEPERGDRLRI